MLGLYAQSMHSYQEKHFSLATCMFVLDYSGCQMYQLETYLFCGAGWPVQCWVNICNNQTAQLAEGFADPTLLIRGFCVMSHTEHTWSSLSNIYPASYVNMGLTTY